MKIIGVTGGIGSGKTTVCQVFSKLGVPVYNADLAAKRLMHTNKKLVAEIKRIFGESMYDQGVLDKEALASVVFTDSKKLVQLNELVHPAVAIDFTDWAKNQHSEIVVKEAAILFETGGFKEMDATILVFAPEEIRLSRVMKRDGASEPEVLSRMKNQWSDERKLKMADHVINNYGEYLILPQIIKLMEEKH